MEEYYFLFIMAFLFIVFATVQDIKKREVANWLNFSLLAFALAYRAFYSLYSGNYNFFVFGFLGVVVFFVIENVFYYSRVFGGGDAKLFLALGAIWPYNSYYDLLFVGFGFIFTLLFVGVIYSLIYSVFLVSRNWSRFKKSFDSYFNRYFKLVFLIAGILFILFSIIESFVFGIFVFLGCLILGVLYFYIKSLDDCMTVLKNPKILSEGDWLEKDIKVGNRYIRKSVHGLSLEEINVLRKMKKKVWIKEGIPFVPVFLITFILMVFFYSFLKFDFQGLLSSLF